MKKCGYASKYKGHIKPTCGCEYCNLLYSQKQAAADMYEALMAIKSDLLERANSDNDDMKVVACGSSVWVQIQDALLKARGEL